jgi:hypothetical protein
MFLVVVIFLLTKLWPSNKDHKYENSGLNHCCILTPPCLTLYLSVVLLSLSVSVSLSLSFFLHFAHPASSVTQLARAHIEDLCALIGTQHRRIDELSAALRSGGGGRTQAHEAVSASTMMTAMGSSRLKEQQQQQQHQYQQQMQQQQQYQHQQQQHGGYESAEVAMRTRALNLLQLNDDATDEHEHAMMAALMRGGGSVRHEHVNHTQVSSGTTAGHTSSDHMHDYYAMRSHAPTNTTLSLTPHRAPSASTTRTPVFQQPVGSSSRPSPAPPMQSFSSHARAQPQQTPQPPMHPASSHAQAQSVSFSTHTQQSTSSLPIPLPPTQQLPPPQSAAKLARREIVLRELREMRAAAAHEVQRALEAGRAAPEDSLRCVCVGVVV